MITDKQSKLLNTFHPEREWIERDALEEVLEELNERIDSASYKLLTEALRLISNDMHTASSRPCATCNTISAIMGEAFGCKRKERK